MSIRHSKFKNTGILFELLVKQITSDTLNGKDSPALNILKKFFTKTELSKELKIYEALNKTQKLSESKANILIQTLLETSKKLNKTSLKKQKYNLINEIKNHYNLDEFFKTKIKNYKQYAALYTLIEAEDINNINPKQIVDNKFTLLECLIQSEVNSSKSNIVIEELKSYDKDIRFLTYKLLLEKFNEKYDNLLDTQKEILKEYITSVDSTPKLKNLYNNKINEIKAQLNKLSNNIDNKVIKIKLNEVLSFIKEIDKNSPVKNEDIIDLMQYYELLNELNGLNEKN